MITVKIFKKKNISLEAEIKNFVIPLAEEHTKKLATETKQEMDNQIDATRERPMAGQLLKPTLKETIQAEKIDGGYGVGNIDTLNQKNKYWAWINYGRAFSGRTIPPGTNENPKIRGHFYPENKGRFVKDQPKFPMNPEKPIKAHNYIEKTLAIILGKIKEILK